MKEFEAFIHSQLPKALDPQVQNDLLLKFYETKDEDTRQILLTHNLRLCAQCAKAYCIQHNCAQYVFDIFTENYLALYNALSEYNPHHSSNKSFTSYAWTSMIRKTSRYCFRENKITNKLADNTLLDKDGTESDEDIFRFLFDQEQSDFPKEIAEQEFFKELVNKISTSNREIVKMYLGIDYPRSFSFQEISHIYNCSKQSVQKRYNREIDKLRQHIAQDCALSYPTFAKEYKTNFYLNLNSKIENSNCSGFQPEKE